MLYALFAVVLARRYVRLTGNSKQKGSIVHKLRCYRNYIILSVIATMTCVSVATFGANEGESPWHISIMAGRLDFEGNEAVYDTFLPSIHLGYDVTEKWTAEGILGFAPDMRENFRNSYGEKISRLNEKAGPGVHDTESIRMAIEGLYHFDRTKKIDPYLAAGGGLVWYADDFKDQYAPELSAGAGLLLNLNQQWALRLDGRVYVAGTSFKGCEFNSLVSAGITWTPSFGASGKSSAGSVIPPVTPPVVKPVEIPNVVTEATDMPKNAKKYELHIEFADNSAEITAQYYGELDVIGRELRDQPDAKATITAHVDQRKNSSEKDAAKLTKKRAVAVSSYLSDKWKIRRSRMETSGLGFSKPKEKPDLENGNSANRRIEIYILNPAGSEKK